MIDVHQHLWPAVFIEALRERTEPPRLRGWTLELEGGLTYEIDPGHHDPSMRAAQTRHDGVDLALVAASSPLGIEHLAARQAARLLETYHEGVLAFPAPFHPWAAAGIRSPDAAALGRSLERGFVGLQLPATALLDADGYRRVAPLLDLLHDADRPLLIHPGPARPGRGAPHWWAAIVDYAQQMHAAWFAFRQFGRPRYRRLRVCFCMLAGLAPLHGERFTARTGERNVLDEDAFVEISSYGTRAVDATVRVLGIDVLVSGSDRPYAEPTAPDLGDAALAMIRRANPLRLLQPKEVSDGMAVAAAAQP